MWLLAVMGGVAGVATVLAFAGHVADSVVVFAGLRSRGITDVAAMLAAAAVSRRRTVSCSGFLQGRQAAVSSGSDRRTGVVFREAFRRVGARMRLQRRAQRRPLVVEVAASPIFATARCGAGVFHYRRLTREA